MDFANVAARATSNEGLSMDALGIFYCCLSVVWTGILIGGMVFLFRRRDMPILRIRGLPLSLGAVTLLHMYWIAVQLGYLYGRWMAASVEYWIMGIWLPFGIALFHASNSRFLYVAEMQKRFVSSSSSSDGSWRKARSKRNRTLVEKYKLLDYTTKMLAVVLTGMALQLFLTLFMFIASRKFHPDFGIPGTETTGTVAEQRTAAGRGWEWWPSVFWQVFWAWLVAPYILWRARGLHDTLGWRVQTIGCCVASLHATPMWLAGLYVPEMAVVNQYWIPPQWIALSIMIIEIFTVFLPCWEVLKHQSLRQETLESIARWEARNRYGEHGGKNGSGEGGSSLDTASSSYYSCTSKKGAKPSSSSGRRGKPASISTSSGNSVLTMDALEHTLVKNPEPLQQFSALKDFSGENIAFLRRVAEWKLRHYGIRMSDGRRMADGNNNNNNSNGGVNAGSKKTGAVTTTTTVNGNNNYDDDDSVDVRAAFEDGLHIYVDYISSRGAEFQVNLASSDFKKLASVFEGAASIVYGEDDRHDPATPFELPGWRISNAVAAAAGRLHHNHHHHDAVSLASSQTALAEPEGVAGAGTTTMTLDSVRYWGDIPESFGEGVFDDAEMHIKYLVLTNTWPKYVKSRRSMDSIDTLEASGTSA